MAPMHDWKDDAEFLRYNRPEAPRWPAYHPWLAIIGACIGIAVCWYAIFKQLGIIP
jgi:hypothetical protein